MASDVCSKCGSTLREGAKFCSACGAPAQAEPPRLETHTHPEAQTTKKEKSRRKWLPLTLAGAGLAGVIVLVILRSRDKRRNCGIEKERGHENH